ncbi:MAG: LPS assembly lipoprotein LptE, partial [Thermoanaerobaculia bacterium]
MSSHGRGRGRVLGTGLRLLFPGWIAVAGTGCGYSLGYQVAPGARTAAVPIFLNTTFPLRREIEFELTSAFRQELLARTRLKLVDESAGPDLVVRGRIVEFREGLVAEGRRDEKVESSVLATVELEVENYLDGTRRLVEPVRDIEPISI